jgi:Fe-S-cluster containining protein
VGGGAAYDCQACGACCVQTGPFDGNAYVYLDRQEASRLRGLGLPVVEAALGARCLGAAPHEGAGGRPACVAFGGVLGGRCGCSVYADRPSVCREFEVGGELCREARHQAGLPV